MQCPFPKAFWTAPTLGRLDRWRKARALFVRPDGAEAERALSHALGKSWSRGQIYGRARRIAVERSVPELLERMEEALGPLAENVRVAPEDPATDEVGRRRKSRAPSGREPPGRGAVARRPSSGPNLFVEFQPIFDLTAGRTLGFEGLLRGQERRRPCVSRRSFSRRRGGSASS